MRVACLVPVRNEAHRIAGFLESAARFADFVVALDDGSTDDSAKLLRSSPLVEKLLERPRRETYEGWDDSANRTSLLEATAALRPDWIVWLDADERLAPDDAEALRTLLRDHARPEHAYGFQLFRLWDGRFDPDFAWVYRAFAWEPDQGLPAERLHFDPIPTSIPRADWIRTTIRVQHRGAATERDVARRLGKYREADPAREYRTNFGGLSLPPQADTEEWQPRPAGLPLIMPPPTPARTLPSAPPDVRVTAGAPIAPARADPQPGPRAAARRSRLVCLLPARDAEGDLAGWFESVERFADAVVALDDGSSDGTRAALEAHPLVERLLVNSPREAYAGWDDAGNRNRLLEAAAELEPDWILSLDADERIDPGDAAALRAFVDGDALPGLAYGLQVHRMIDGLERYDRADLWVYRLFAWEGGESFPERRLHFVPIPSSIPRSRWIRTSIRIQHLGSATEGRRHARFEKYREADPERAFQGDYSNLLEAPGELRTWEPRAPGAPVLVADGTVAVDDDAEDDHPLLSAIVISRDDEDRIERVVRSVVEQETPHAFEVIVVTSGTDRTAAIVREAFPQVTLVELDRPALPGRARNAGLRLARADYVSFPGSHIELAPGSLAARMEAHESGYGMVTGTTLNGTKTCAGWASYFLDHSSVLPSRPSEPLGGPPAHCSYARHLLLFVGGFPEDMRAGEDTVVNRELWEFRYRAWRARDARIVHNTPCRTPWRLVRHHYTRGRGMGRILLDDRRSGKLTRARLRSFMRHYLPRRMKATGENVRQWGGPLARVYRLVLPLVVAASAAAWLGALRELAAPRARALAPVGRRPRSEGAR